MPFHYLKEKHPDLRRRQGFHLDSRVRQQTLRFVLSGAHSVLPAFFPAIVAEQVGPAREGT